MTDMFFWVAFFFSSILQEPTATGAFMLSAQHDHRNLGLLFLVWFAATTLDVMVGYCFSRFARAKFSGSRFVVWSERVAATSTSYFGNIGKRLLLFFLGFFSLPWLNGLIAPWLDATLGESIILIVFGDFIWFFIEWFVIIGIASVIPNFQTAMIVVVVLGALGTLVWYRLRNKTGFMR